MSGIDRSILYTNRKYHSGLICSGVTIGLLIIQLSASINVNGAAVTNSTSTINITIKVTKSLIKK